MTSPAKRPFPLGSRPAARPQGDGLQGKGLLPLPPERPGPGRWLVGAVVALCLLLAVTWLLGRTVEPFRVRLSHLPVVGEALFGEPVWPVLWNRPPAGAGGEEAASGADGAEPGAAEPGDGSASGPASDGEAAGAELSAGLSALEAEIAARLAAVEVRENEVRAREADLQQREQALQEQERRLSEVIRETEALREQLQGQLRTEEDRVAVIREMKTSAVVRLFEAMTDDEVIAVLKHMEAEEAGRILEDMDPYRAARILHKLTAGDPAATAP